MFCPQCGNANAMLGAACGSCGVVLPANWTAPPSVKKPAAEAVDEAEFYETAVGLNGGRDYYLSRFQWYDAQGGVRAGWHWPAFFFTFWWMLYRKMWRASLIYFLAPYVLLLALAAVLTLVGETVGGVLSLAVLVLYLGWIYVWIPAHATGMYYRHCQAKIAESKRLSRNEQKQLRALAAKGGTSGVVVFLIMFLAVVPIIGILAAVAIPQYNDYLIRSHMRGVQVYASGATEAVAAYYYKTGAVPGSLDEAGFTQAPPEAVSTAAVGRGGVLTITMAKPLAGKRLVFSPALDENQRIVWECGSEDIPKRNLPPECRR